MLFRSLARPHSEFLSPSTAPTCGVDMPVAALWTWLGRGHVKRPNGPSHGPAWVVRMCFSFYMIGRRGTISQSAGGVVIIHVHLVQNTHTKMLLKKATCSGDTRRKVSAT